MSGQGDNDDFEPRLGRQKGSGAARQSFVDRVLLVAGVAGRSAGNAARFSSARARRFDGSRIGRGASIGRLLSSRDALATMRTRRAVVKTSLIRLSGQGMGIARAHLRYIQRDGVTREGNPGELYGRDQDPAEGPVDAREFIERCDGDRHQFRFIVSPEDGDRYDDLQSFVRRLMCQVEKDLDTRLDWVAVDHHNTGHPHSHIVLRGVDDSGKNLIIAREYIAHGLRARAVELLNRDLGPRLDHEIEERLRHDVTQERLTATDRRLLERMDERHCIAISSEQPFRALEAGRLQHLERIGLALRETSDVWKLDERFETTLVAMGERGDVIRLMQRAMTAARIERSDHRIHGAIDGPLHQPLEAPLLGRVIRRGLADEHRDRHFLVIDGVDGRSHYLDIGKAGAVDPLPEKAIVKVTPRLAGLRDVDRTIIAVAAASDGAYSARLHRDRDPSVGTAFAETHVRRLEAMRRAGVSLIRADDGAWRIAPDHPDKVAAFERGRLADRPVDVEVVAKGPLETLARANAATWLDAELTAGGAESARKAGFGREVSDALALRRQWLIEENLAVSDGDTFHLRRGALDVLRRRELLRLSRGIGEEIGKTFVEAKIGERIEGRLSRRVEGLSGSFALVERSREFTLVPWREVLARHIGKQAGGIMRETGINWHFGRTRQGPDMPGM